MSAGEGDDVEFSLAPQWLRGHGIHSPIAAGSTISGRRDAAQPRASSSSELGPQTPQHRNKALGLGTSRSEEQAFRSPGKRSSGSSSRPYPGSHRSSKPLLEDRYYSTHTPFSSSALGAHSSGSSSAAASWLSQHAGPGHMAPGGNGAADSQLGQGGAAALKGPTGLQRSVSEGYNTASSAGSKAFRKLALDSHHFPSLAVTTSSSSSSTSAHSSKRGGSPQPYTPSVAPYKQEFLASRGTSGWTSKLAVVPGSADAEADSSTHSSSLAVTATAAAAAAVDAKNKRVALASSPTLNGPRSTATTVSSPEPAPAAAISSPAPNLAQTLKQSVAASNSTAAEATKRHQKGLLTLLSSSKAVHGGTTTTTRTAVRKQTDAAKPAAGGRVKPLGPPVAAPSHAASAIQPSFVPLSHSSSGSAGSAAEGPPSNKEFPDVSSASSRQAGQQQQQQQHQTGSVGSTGTAEQRQQLRDRHSFFAVLRRKTSSSSTGSGSGGTAVAKPVAALDVRHAADRNPHKDSHSADAGTAGGAVDDTAAAVSSLEDDIHAEDQQHTRHKVNSVTGADFTEKQHQQQQQTASGLTVVQQAAPSSAALELVSSKSSSNDGAVAKPLADSSNGADTIAAGAAQDCSVHITGNPPCTINGEVQAGRQLQPQVSWELASEEEEEAFLRSLGWTAEASDDETSWGLTEEEIAAFQTFAADRTAHQQQHYRVGFNTTLVHRHGASSAAAQQQQKLNNKPFAGGMLQQRGTRGVTYGVGCAQQLQQRAVVLGANAHYGLYDVHSAGHGCCGLMLGVYMPPVANVLECDSESSSDDEE